MYDAVEGSCARLERNPEPVDKYEVILLLCTEKETGLRDGNPSVLNAGVIVCIYARVRNMQEEILHKFSTMNLIGKLHHDLLHTCA